MADVLAARTCIGVRTSLFLLASTASFIYPTGVHKFVEIYFFKLPIKSHSIFIKNLHFIHFTRCTDETTGLGYKWKDQLLHEEEDTMLLKNPKFIEEVCVFCVQKIGSFDIMTVTWRH